MLTHTLSEIAINYFIIAAGGFLTIPLIAETKQDVKVISAMSVIIPAVLLMLIKW